MLPKDAVPLSVLNLRSPLRTAASQELERELTVPLIQRLTRERNVWSACRREPETPDDSCRPNIVQRE